MPPAVGLVVLGHPHIGKVGPPVAPQQHVPQCYVPVPQPRLPVQAVQTQRHMPRPRHRLLQRVRLLGEAVDALLQAFHAQRRHHERRPRQRPRPLLLDHPHQPHHRHRARQQRRFPISVVNAACDHWPRNTLTATSSTSPPAPTRQKWPDPLITASVASTILSPARNRPLTDLSDANTRRIARSWVKC
jgi:hypothetical protein